VQSASRHDFVGTRVDRGVDRSDFIPVDQDRDLDATAWQDDRCITDERFHKGCANKRARDSSGRWILFTIRQSPHTPSAKTRVALATFRTGAFLYAFWRKEYGNEAALQVLLKAASKRLNRLQ
jgi:hypothetical protein